MLLKRLRFRDKIPLPSSLPAPLLNYGVHTSLEIHQTAIGLRDNLGFRPLGGNPQTPKFRGRLRPPNPLQKGLLG
jgi:hypothetical protein